MRVLLYMGVEVGVRPYIILLFHALHGSGNGYPLIYHSAVSCSTCKRNYVSAPPSFCCFMLYMGVAVGVRSSIIFAIPCSKWEWKWLSTHLSFCCCMLYIGVEVGVRSSILFLITTYAGNASPPVTMGDFFWFHVHYKCSSGRPKISSVLRVN
jgi:hypothetical protein